ncbi:MAG: TIGR00366 family protein, partial [Bacteroidales bacterium]|nr:TIGR00366 family protein [Bacteroidales bacterium]
MPLTMATEGSNLEAVTKGALTHPVPIGQTILAPQNLIMVAAVIVAIVVVNSLMHP